MEETTQNPQQWREGDSETFLDLGELLVPARTEQIATLLQLLPARRDEVFTAVELGAGGGLLARAILEHFPACSYVAFDGSETMREQMRQTLASFGNRLDVRPFDLADSTWRGTLPSPLRCVLSSLCVHHLTDEEKRQLFADLAPQLEPGGALLLADVIEPISGRVAELFAQQYDDIIRQQSLALRGDLSGYEQFQQLEWNYFLHDYGSADTIDHPSVLSDQLRWLHEAGFSAVDCFWIRAGHAVYGGYK